MDVLENYGYLVIGSCIFASATGAVCARIFGLGKMVTLFAVVLTGVGTVILVECVLATDKTWWGAAGYCFVLLTGVLCARLLRAARQKEVGRTTTR